MDRDCKRAPTHSQLDKRHHDTKSTIAVAKELHALARRRAGPAMAVT
jgi:hypothetical protein